MEFSNVGPATNLQLTGTSVTPAARAMRPSGAAAAREPPRRIALRWADVSGFRNGEQTIW